MSCQRFKKFCRRSRKLRVLRSAIVPKSGAIVKKLSFGCSLPVAPCLLPLASCPLPHLEFVVQGVLKKISTQKTLILTLIHIFQISLDPIRGGGHLNVA